MYEKKKKKEEDGKFEEKKYGVNKVSSEKRM